MKWLSVVLVLSAGLCHGQEIGGLAQIEPNREERFPIKGIEVKGGNLDEVSKWLGKCRVAVDGPSDAVTSVDLDMTIGRKQPIIYFGSNKPGLYVLCFVDPSASDPKIVTKRVTVGNPPQPEPGPVVPTPVVTKGPKTILMAYETTDTSPALQRIITWMRNDQTFGKMLTDSKHNLVILDDDLELPKGATEPLKKAAMLAASQTKPCFVVVDNSDQSKTYSASFSVRDSREQLLELLKKGGVE